jgi:stage V sporulation protein G
LNPDRAPRDPEGRAKLYADIAHPINSTCREAIQEKVIAAYREELELSKQPGYVSRYDDEYEGDAGPAELAEPRSPAQETGYQRTDPAASSSEPPPPHVKAPSSQPQQPEKPSTPHSNRLRKPGFGAGILDD